jgi:hypothetical protein
MMSKLTPHHSCAVLHFPLRRIPTVLITPERDGPGWLALIGDHGWLFGSRADAIVEAKWLANNFRLPVRECVMTGAELLAKYSIKLENATAGRHYAICPQCSHTRSTPAHRAEKKLGVTIEPDGSVRWGCNHCGWTGPEKGSSGEPRGNAGAHIIYDYRDADGALLFQKVRNPPGSEKRFYCRRPDGNGGWINNTKGIDHKPLYRWSEIRKAKAQARMIALVEGEKDADALWALDIPATCNFDGATDVIKNPKAKPKWKIEYSEQLAGADLVVLNDNDPPGYAHADHICRTSINRAARVRRLDLAPHWPNMPQGADVSDWLALGHTCDELAALIATAPDYAPPEAAESAKPEAALGNGVDDDAEIERLARLSPMDYDRARKDAGKRLGISRLSTLDIMVKGKRVELGLNGGDDKQGHAIAFTEPEPWPDSVNGVALLDALADGFGQYVVMTESMPYGQKIETVEKTVSRPFPA